ncbi:lipocalin family protein [uncultured Polaribacter sp.]|uniref:lipocalin family protein n=1 Tax=uncultured Polaribacter sp. TaxID=174711 RepID=UPI002625560E|nr:lipocalin family protein [uncultured Polaribacter sp.]
MKKILILVLTATLFSCGATKTLKTKKKTIKGNWTLSKITYSKTGNYNVTFFGDASKDCLEGSSWKFVPNNNSGVYTINESGCVAGEREFIFVIQEIDTNSGYYDFMLKPKNNEGNLGYRIDLKALTETEMLWRQKIIIDGTPFLINMNFTKQ